MKKVISIVAIFSFIILCMPTALALENPMDYPVLPEGHPEYHMPAAEQPIATIFPKDDVYAASVIEVEITQSGEAPYEVTWTATATGGDGNYTYFFQILISDGDRDYFDYQPPGNDNTFSYYFPMNGNWELHVSVSDNSGNTGSASLLGSVNVEDLVPLVIQSIDTMGDYITDTTTWTVTASGGSGKYTYLFYLVENDSTEFDDATIVCHSDYSEDNSFCYQFLANGNYSLLVWVMDEHNHTVQEDLYIHVEVEGCQTVYERAAELVAQCKAEGNTSDYDMALWLHDWLIYHANYDYSYSYYHADRVLFGKTGVCDSYSKAYLLLLKEAGIPAIRVTNNGHAWNALCLDGDWYTVDVTWDDPNEGGGYENHYYCFIPDEIMDIDHKNHIYEVSCNSYEYNYYMQNGEAENWANELADYVDSGLAEGCYNFRIDLPYWYSVEGRIIYGRNRPITVLCDHLSLELAVRQREHLYEGQVVPLNYVYEDGAEASVLVDFSGKTITIPENTLSIGCEALAGLETPLCVQMKHVVEIETGAFAGCDSLWAVFITESVTAIEDGAFDTGNSHLTIVAPSGSVAQEYADANDIRFEAMM